MKWATKIFQLPITEGRNKKTIQICQILTEDSLSFLEDTAWKKGIHFVSADAMSHALHGWVQPLLRELGPEPKYTCKKISQKEGLCSLYNDCINAKKTCQPKYITTLPPCYEAPIDNPTHQWVVNEIVHQWTQGVFVIVVKGNEFSLS